MTADRNWREVLSGVSQLPRDWLDTAQRWHRHFLLKAIPAILLTLVLGVGLNAAGWKEVNFLFALAAILGGLFFATQPKTVLSVFGVGTLWNGLLDSKVTGAKANLDQGLQFVSDKYIRPVGHVLLLTTVVFVFLGTYRIQNPLAILPLIVVVMGLGLWAALFASDTTWYRRITLKILLVAGVGSVIGAYFYTPSRTEKLAEEIRAASETNLDKRNAGQVEALKKFVAEGGVLSPEQQAILDQKASEVSGKDKLLRKAQEFLGGKVDNENQQIVFSDPKLKPGRVNYEIGDKFNYIQYSYNNGRKIELGEDNLSVMALETDRDGRAIWKILGHISHGEMNLNITYWVDNKEGIVVRTSSTRQYSKPIVMIIGNNETAAVTQEIEKREYVLSENEVIVDKRVTGPSGMHNVNKNDKFPFGYQIFRLTRKVEIDEWYPWKTPVMPSQVMADKKIINVPAGSFICWVVLQVQSAGHQHYLNYYDMGTGLLIKNENYVKRNNRWELIDEKVLASYKMKMLDRLLLH